MPVRCYRAPASDGTPTASQQQQVCFQRCEEAQLGHLRRQAVRGSRVRAGRPEHVHDDLPQRPGTPPPPRAPARRKPADRRNKNHYPRTGRDVEIPHPESRPGAGPSSGRRCRPPQHGQAGEIQGPGRLRPGRRHRRDCRVGGPSCRDGAQAGPGDMAAVAQTRNLRPRRRQQGAAHSRPVRRCAGLDRDAVLRGRAVRAAVDRRPHRAPVHAPPRPRPAAGPVIVPLCQGCLHDAAHSRFGFVFQAFNPPPPRRGRSTTRSAPRTSRR